MVSFPANAVIRAAIIHTIPPVVSIAGVAVKDSRQNLGVMPQRWVVVIGAIYGGMNAETEVVMSGRHGQRVGIASHAPRVIPGGTGQGVRTIQTTLYAPMYVAVRDCSATGDLPGDRRSAARWHGRRPGGDLHARRLHGQTRQVNAGGPCTTGDQDSHANDNAQSKKQACFHRKWLFHT